MSENNFYWYAIYTKPRWEKKIATILSEKGIENYCPLNKVIKQWSDRKKVVLEPVFKSYIFVYVNENAKWELKRINGILNFVYWLGKPAIIREEEIVTIKKFLNEFSNIQVENTTDLKVNTEVRIKQGILMNYKGLILEVVGNKAKVKIDSMGVSLYAQFDKKNLEAFSNI